VFASLGVGLPVLIAAAHFFGRRRRDEVWMRLAVRLTRAFTVLVVVGVISGIVISVELVLLWPRFMTAAGPVIGLPFSLETYAFFLEAIFLSLCLFGRSRPSPWVHWTTLLPVCLGALASAWHRGRGERVDERPDGLQLLARAVHPIATVVAGMVKGARNLPASAGERRTHRPPRGA